MFDPLFSLPIRTRPPSPKDKVLTAVSGLHSIEVNVSDLGIVTASGKIAWGRYAQITNNPEVCSLPFTL